MKEISLRASQDFIPKFGGYLDILMGFAFLAGVFTILSPCVLPVLPALLSASIGGGKQRPLGVVVGLILSFTFFTLALTAIVKQFGISANLLRQVAILLIGFFGFVMVLPFLSNWFARATNSVANWGIRIQLRKEAQQSGFFGGFILGGALGLIWTPCAGPILAAITTLVATQAITLKIVALTLSYSLGAGIPLLLIAYGGNKALASLPFLSRNSEIIRQFFGWIMILTAIALAFNLDVALQQRVLEYLPNIQIENNSRVQQELNKLRPAPLSFPGLEVRPRVQEGEELPQLAVAPELVGLSDWINTAPLTIAGLKGQVILIDFWTYSCINCIRTLPYLKQWLEKYNDKGLVIIGVHTPEFEFEKDLKNVENAVERFKIHYPVALDNQYETWQAYHNSYWPAKYLIDQNGIIRYVHFGEGEYSETENAIRSLLKMPTLQASQQTHIAYRPTTPEIYLGYQRAANYSSDIHLLPNKTISYSYDQPLEEDQIGLKGTWRASQEYISSESETASLELNFISNRVYIVLGGESNLPIQIELDGSPLPQKYHTMDTNQGRLFVKEDRKYDLANLQGDYGRHRLTLYIPKGIKAYTFTFGGEEE